MLMLLSMSPILFGVCDERGTDNCLGRRKNSASLMSPYVTIYPPHSLDCTAESEEKASSQVAAAVERETQAWRRRVEEVTEALGTSEQKAQVSREGEQ